MSGFFPAPTPEIFVNNVDAFDLLEFLGQEILEGAAPERHRPSLADDPGEVVELQLSRIENRPEMIRQDLLEAWGPFVTGEEFHQTLEVMACWHGVCAYVRCPVPNSACLSVFIKQNREGALLSSDVLGCVASQG